MGIDRRQVDIIVLEEACKHEEKSRNNEFDCLSAYFLLHTYSLCNLLYANQYLFIISVISKYYFFFLNKDLMEAMQNS